MRVFCVLLAVGFLSTEAHGMALFSKLFGSSNRNKSPSANQQRVTTPTRNPRLGGSSSTGDVGAVGGRHWYKGSKAKYQKSDCLPKRLTNQINHMGKYFGKKVQVVSAHRPKANNTMNGGAKKSEHINCNAVDFTVPGVSRGKIRGYLSALYRTGKWGIGFYCNDRYHLDTGGRNGKRVWGVCYPREIKRMLSPHKRLTATYQSIPVSNSAVMKTAVGDSPGKQFKRSSASTSGRSVD